MAPKIDRETLGALIAAGRAPGAILDGRSPELARRLALAWPPEQPVRVEAGGESFPSRTRGRAPGAPLWVAGSRQGDGPIRVQIGAGEPLVLVPRPASASALRIERSFLRAQRAALREASELAAPVAREAPLPAPPPLGPFDLPLDMRARARAIWSIDPSYARSAYIPPRMLTWQEWRREDAHRRRVPVVLAEHAQTRLALDISVDRMRSTAAPLGWPPPGGTEIRDRKPRWRTPYTGALEAAMAALARGDLDGALLRAVRWQLAQPEDVAAVLALGESLEARGAGALAARAYASLMDLYPLRADLLGAAGQRLERVAASEPAVRALAIDA